MENKKLKACPVCGEALVLIEDEGKWRIVCTVCEFEDGPFDTEEEALERWFDEKA